MDWHRFASDESYRDGCLAGILTQVQDDDFRNAVKVAVQQTVDRDIIPTLGAAARKAVLDATNTQWFENAVRREVQKIASIQVSINADGMRSVD